MDKIWLESYADGIPEELPAPEFMSLRELIDHSFKKYADRPCYTNMGTTITYRDLDRLSMQFASYLQNSLGLVKGERVAIMLPNILQYPVTSKWHFSGRPCRGKRKSTLHGTRTQAPVVGLRCSLHRSAG